MFEQITLPPAATEWVLVALAVLVGVVGLVIGWRATLARPVPLPEAAPPERGVNRLLFHKYWVDEHYQRFIVTPVVSLSRGLLWKVVDKGLIDGAAVHGPAWVARSVLGRAGSLLQSGQVGLYVIFFLIGALWILRVAIG